MNKTIATLSGAAAGAVSIFIASKIVLLLLYIPYLLFPDFTGTAVNLPGVIFLLLAPVIFCAVMIELSGIMIRKTGNDFFRIGAIVFNLVNTGYVIVTAGLGIASVVAQKDFLSKWHTLLLATGTGYMQRLMIVLFLMILIFGYLNISTKRFRSNIPVIKKM